MSGVPTGTVTFFFTDIEGSTRLAQEHPNTWEVLRARHHDILRSVIEAHNGYIFQIIGDAFCVAFHTAGDALRAAAKAQTDLHAENWGDAHIKVRIGIHTGKAEIQPDGEYHGYLAMSRVQRLMSAGHGGQVLISAAAQELLLEDLPEDVTLRDLGEQRLKDLVRPEHIYQMIRANLPVDFPPIKSLDILPNNLPIQLTSFIGREKELGELKERMARSRLVTLTGVGGTGKTRLALQAGADVVDEFRDGVWLVELAPLSDPEHVPQAVAAALHLLEQTGRAFLDLLKDYLARKNVLLLLDNCEHLIEACAQLADVLLHAAPHLKILVTSREALGIAGESTYPVHSLSLPDLSQPSPEILSQYEAVQLFIDRALAVQPNFQVTNQNALAVAEICARLDGIPLAIELAAARVRGLSAEQIASRLHDRFRLLTGGSRTALPRQRTLQATIDWSYRLLSEEERVLMRRLSIFADGWTLEGAEQVCASEDLGSDQILDLLLRLVDKSLVVVEMDSSELSPLTGETPRYRMLETIRQYAQEKLDETAGSKAMRDRHLEYFRALAEQARPHIISSQQALWLVRLETELDNIRTALHWAQDAGSVQSGLRLATGLEMFWFYRNHFREACLVLETLLDKAGPDEEIEALARAHLALGTLLAYSGHQSAGYTHALESERLFLQLGPAGKAGLARVMNLLIESDAKIADDPIRLIQALEENLKQFQEAGDASGTAHALSALDGVLSRIGDFVNARRRAEQSLAIFRECGDNFRVAQQIAELAIIDFEEGKYAEARTRFEEVLSFYRQMPVIFAVNIPMWILGAIAIRESDTARAKAWYSECLLFGKKNSLILLNQFAECLVGFAGIAHAEKRFERAAQLVGAAEAEVEARQGPFPLEHFDQAELERLTTVLREELGELKFEALAAEGRAMTMEQAIAYALEDQGA